MNYTILASAICISTGLLLALGHYLVNPKWSTCCVAFGAVAGVLLWVEMVT